jgi:hypothetical protein
MVIIITNINLHHSIHVYIGITFFCVSIVLYFRLRADWLIIYCFTSRSRFFFYLTITDQGLQNLGVCSVLLNREGSLSCHTCYDTGPLFSRSDPKDRPIQSPLTTHKMWGFGGSILTRILTYLTLAQWKRDVRYISSIFVVNIQSTCFHLNN